MKKWFLLVLALLVAVSVGASEFKNGQTVGTRSHSGTIVGGWYSVDSTGRYLLFDINGNLNVVDASRDRDLEYYATAINSTALDTGAVTYSGPLDLRKYSSFAVTIHITPATADSVYTNTYDYGVTVFSLPSQTFDWTGYGVAPIARQHGWTNHTDIGAEPWNNSTQADTTSGFYLHSFAPNALITAPGERLVRLRSTIPLAQKAYANRNLTRTVRISSADLLAPGDRPRYIGIQLRGMARASSAVATVRVDVEALR